MKLFVLLYLSCYSPNICDSQKTFSPFAFLGNLFKSPPSWTSPRQVNKFRSPTTRSKKSFRPHLPIGTLFTASQEVRQAVKFPNKLQSTEFAPWPLPVQTYPVISVSYSNNSKSSPTPSPIYIKSFTTTRTTKSPFVPSTSEFQVTENDFHNQKIIEIDKQTNKGPDKALYPITIAKPEQPLSQNSANTVTPQSSFSSYSPSHDRGLSGPNPGDFPIISLIDEPSINYYQQIFKSPVSSIYKDSSKIVPIHIMHQKSSPITKTQY